MSTYGCVVVEDEPLTLTNSITRRLPAGMVSSVPVTPLKSRFTVAWHARRAPMATSRTGSRGDAGLPTWTVAFGESWTVGELATVTAGVLATVTEAVPWTFTGTGWSTPFTTTTLLFGAARDGDAREAAASAASR